MEEETFHVLQTGEKVALGIVIPAAGKGERMSMSRPKQFLTVCARPVIAHTINGFAPLVNSIKAIIVPVAENHEDTMSSIIKEHVLDKLRGKVIVIQGSTSRHRSIMAGVSELEKYKVDITIIHDAVRPIVDVPLVRRLIDAAVKHGAAGSISKLCSTVLQVGDGSFLEQSLDRYLYVESHTPQTFQQKLLLNAYENASDIELANGTECLALVDKQLLADGRANCVKLIEGNPNFLWKITHRKDLLNAFNRDTLLNSSDDPENLGDLLQIKLINNHSDVKSNHAPLLDDIHCILDSFACELILVESVESLNDTGNEVTANCDDEDEYPATAPGSARKVANVVVRFSETEEAFVCQVRELECSFNSRKSQRNICIFVLDNTPTVTRVKMMQELDCLLRRGITCIIYLSPKDSDTLPTLVHKFRKQLHEIITSCLLHLPSFSSQLFFIGL